jgi:hypothetical protein
MKFITNNFSLNMVTTSVDYSIDVTYLSLAEFKEECSDAVNRLSKMDICQELDLYPQQGNVAAGIGDAILVAQYFDGVLTFRKLTVRSR